MIVDTYTIILMFNIMIYFIEGLRGYYSIET